MKQEWLSFEIHQICEMSINTKEQLNFKLLRALSNALENTERCLYNPKSHDWSSLSYFHGFNSVLLTNARMELFN